MRENTFIIVIMTMMGLGGRVSRTPSPKATPTTTMVATMVTIMMSISLVAGGVRDEVKALAGSSVSLRCAVNR